MKILTTKIIPDAFTEKIGKVFDYNFDGTSTFTVPDLAPPKDFSLGIIVGSSGSGKTQMLRHHFSYSEPNIQWNPEKAVISHFENPDVAVELMFAVGLSSIPTLCRPFHVLSNGEQFRATVARQLASGARIDEFTSVVNRETAKSLSVSLSKYIRGKGLKDIVMASCHRDILDWLEPDWVFDCDMFAMKQPSLFTNDINFAQRKRHAEIKIY